MKRAMIRVADGYVMQVEPMGGDFAVTAEYQWVNCPDNVTDDFTYDGTNFNEPPPPPPPPEPPIPSTVSMYQARTALSRAGHLATVEAALATMPGPAGEEARIKWEFAPTVKRTDALTAAMAGVLGLTEQQLDDLFTTAAAII